MSLFHPPPPSDGGGIFKNVEVSPDIVFVISTAPDGTAPLGYFCSTGAAALNVGWLSFPASSDTWCWFNNPPPPPGGPPGPPQFGDAAWPATFYLVPQMAQGWTPPPAPAAGTTWSVYASAGSWTGSGAPDPSVSAWLVAKNPAPAGMGSVAFVQLVNGKRTWYKSGTIAANNSWEGDYVALPSGGYLALSQQAPGAPGTDLRLALVTPKK